MTGNSMTGRATRTHYDLLGVDPTCSYEELRAAYRRAARARHPDVASQKSGATMAEVNEAWRVLSDKSLRRDYDLSIAMQRPVVRPGHKPREPAPNPVPTGSRRQAWVAGVQAQMARLTRLAGRSATQTLLIRNPRGPRSAYEEIVDDLVRRISADTESRVRAARAAGTAPLDLGVGATLIGIRSVADAVRREGSVQVTTEVLMAAELLDRMWDVIAHELPVQLTSTLGGNPAVARSLQGPR